MEKGVYFCILRQEKSAGFPALDAKIEHQSVFRPVSTSRDLKYPGPHGPRASNRDYQIAGHTFKDFNLQLFKRVIDYPFSLSHTAAISASNFHRFYVLGFLFFYWLL